MKILRKRGTFVFVTKKKAYIIQFSLKDPWLLPRHDPHHSEADANLYGWLFFYFGWYN